MTNHYRDFSFNVFGERDPGKRVRRDYSGIRAQVKAIDLMHALAADVRRGRQSKEQALRLLADHVKSGLLHEEEVERLLDAAAAARAKTIEEANRPGIIRPPGVTSLPGHPAAGRSDDGA